MTTDPRAALSPLSGSATPSSGPSVKAWFRRYLNSHFAPAFFFLDAERRRALKGVYAVFRRLDDVVDEGRSDAPAVLDRWRRVFAEGSIEAAAGTEDEGLATAFREIVVRYGLPSEALVDFIDRGVSVDLKPVRFGTPMDLESYCYGVAGTVGLACLPVFGVPWMEAKDFAVRLGITVQWINAMRDVGVDARMGRIYLPLDHLERFGLTENDIFAARATDGFFELMRHESGVARGHYARALELLPQRWRRELLPARIMGRIYMKLLEKLERRHYPVFEQKIGLTLVEKVSATWKEWKN